MNALLEESYILPESPRWFQGTGALFFTDISGKTLYSYKNGKVDEIAAGKNISSIAENDTGEIICGCLDGLFLYTAEGKFVSIRTDCNGISLKINDMAIDKYGRILFGTNYFNSEGRYELGCLYSLDIYGVLRMLDKGIHLSNGITFSPDQHTLYLADSAVHTIYAYDYDPYEGICKNKRIFVKQRLDDGLPDGIVADCKGNIYTAQWFGGCIIRYDKTGEEDKRFPVPAKRVSAVELGGGDMKTLYITTSSARGKMDIAPHDFDYSLVDLSGEIVL